MSRSYLSLSQGIAWRVQVLQHNVQNEKPVVARSTTKADPAREMRSVVKPGRSQGNAQSENSLLLSDFEQETGEPKQDMQDAFADDFWEKRVVPAPASFPPKSCFVACEPAHFRASMDAGHSAVGLCVSDFRGALDLLRCAPHKDCHRPDLAL